MIAKLQSISYTKNALSYCEKGGELLYSHKCLGTADEIHNQMKHQNRWNDKCKKQTFHVKIRIAPEDQGKLTTQDWIDISEKYAEKIGFQNNLFAVYIHEEGSDKEHIHIVSSRIRDDNKAVPDDFTHYKNMDFCREIEKDYQLRMVERRLEKIKMNQEFESNDARLLKLRDLVFSVVKFSDTLEDVKFHLKQHKVGVNIGRGISFVDQDGVKVKGSKLDRKLSLNGIEELLNSNHFIQEDYDEPSSRKKRKIRRRL